MANILVIHGPNLNLLGRREPRVYGQITLESIDNQLSKHAAEKKHTLQSFQSNAEHKIVERIHKSVDDHVHGIIINPAGLSHSLVLRDALLGVGIPFIEMHISNVFARENYRVQSMFADIAHGYICGLGHYGYICALEAMLYQLERD